MYDDGAALMPVDAMYIWAVISFGLGLSLASYHWFARRNNWSMGEVQAHHVSIAVFLGICAMIPALLFAAVRWQEFGGWSIPLVGLALGLFFTAILRFYSQISLFLAPMAAVMLSFIWYMR